MADRKADLEIKGEKLPQMIEEDNNDSYSKSGCELNTEQIGKEQENLNMMLDKIDDSDLKFDSKSGFEQTEYRFDQEKEVREEIVIDGDEEIERQQKHSMHQLLALYQQEDQQQIWQNFGYSINHITKTTQLEDHRAQIMQQRNIEQQQIQPSQQQMESARLGPLPPGWEQEETNEGEVYFINHHEKKTSWFDPRVPIASRKQMQAYDQLLAEGMGPNYAGNNQSGARSESDPKSDVEDNFSSGSSNSEFERIDMPANDDALDQDDDDKASFEVIDEEIGEINSLEIQDFNKINVLNFKSTDVNDDQIFANDSEKVYYDEFKDKCEENYFKPSEEYLGSPDSSITLHRFEVKPVKPEIHQLTSYQTRNASADNKYSFIPEISTGIKTHYEKLCKEDNNKWNTSTNSEYPFIPEISTGIKTHYEKLCKEDNNKWNASTNSKYPFIPEISTGIKTHYEKLCKEDNNKWNASTNSKYPFIPEISTGIKFHYEKLCKEDNNKWFLDSDRNGDEDEEKQEQTTYELENAEAIQDLLIKTGGRVDLAVEYLQRLEGYLNNAVGQKAYIQDDYDSDLDKSESGKVKEIESSSRSQSSESSYEVGDATNKVILGHEKVLSELKDHKNTLKILKENMASDGDGIFTIHSQMSELKNKLFESEKNVEDLKMELSEAKKHQQQELPVDINKQLMRETETENNNSAEDTHHLHTKWKRTIISFFPLITMFFAILILEAMPEEWRLKSIFKKMDEINNQATIEAYDWKTKYLLEKQINEDLTAEIADKSEEILLERQRNVNLATFVGEKYLENQNLAAKTEKNFYSKIWALLAWNICFRPPRYFVAILLVLWSFFGI